ncbi:MerR family transcriptional regulator [Actinomadura graeca]|uniref:MerR family transcriptional regulator n=1 Tax=Actinomadura graeca TaxID=2750812 RepID=A0ABX8QV55_9ACTN|nr:MerR family transcriptional regulator [Actinomadura graeca]QXJ22701.1 MerR family transcriptional regulator [Actinomadura graeca]
MTTAPETLSIGEVSALTGLSAHTLRFYEQEGLFVTPVRRSSAGRRVFTQQEVGWLKVCTKLRSSGMSLPDIRRYADLVRQGPGNEADRFEILSRHEAKVQRQMADLQEALDVIRGKVALYADHLASGSADRLWRDGPDCSPPRRDP